MYMSEADICREYRQAKNKNAQVQVLADLNGTNKKIILDILQRGGEFEAKPSEPKTKAPKKTVAIKGFWTPELTNDMLRMRDEGLSYEEIGEKLGVNKRAICDKVHALRNKGLLPPSKRRKAPDKEPLATQAEPRPIIQDSGDRREFETGAVRDMAEGKGRYDLLPWEAIHEVAKHCEEGALKYEERNCEKGIPIHSLIDSAIRHLSCYMRGKKDEPHLRAAAWNILFAMWTEEKHPELQDIPSRKDQ